MSAIRRIGVLVSVLAIVLLSINLPAVNAQDAITGQGSGLNISPTRTELRIEPARVDVVTISLRNVSGTDIIAKVFVNDFESDDITGEPNLIVDSSRELPTSIRNFLVGLADVPLKKDEEKTFDIPVQIPEGTAAGAYYGVVRYLAAPVSPSGGGDSQVSLNASVGSLVLIEVPGDITEQVQLRGIKIFNGDKEGTVFTKSPSQIGVEVRNTGTTFSKPFGTVEIKNMFGKVVHQYELNDTIPKGNVLPQSTRMFKNDLNGTKTFGRYTVVANVSYANGGEVLTSKKVFWYLPLWFIILLTALVIALAIGGKLLYDKKFSRKRK